MTECITPSFLKKFKDVLMRSKSHLSAFLKHQKIIGFPNDEGAVGDHDQGHALRLEDSEGFQKAPLRGHIQVRTGFIEDDQFRFTVKCSRQRNQLPLSP